MNPETRVRLLAGIAVLLLTIQGIRWWQAQQTQGAWWDLNQAEQLYQQKQQEVARLPAYQQVLQELDAQWQQVRLSIWQDTSPQTAAAAMQQSLRTLSNQEGVGIRRLEQPQWFALQTHLEQAPTHYIEMKVELEATPAALMLWLQALEAHTPSFYLKETLIRAQDREGRALVQSLTLGGFFLPRS